MTDELKMELEHDLDPETEALEATAVAPEDRPPLELTETALEGLLFVAERPLTRREIATLAGVDRETVDARLGDLEVSLGERGIRLIVDGDRIELATAPEAGALVARYIGADAIRLSPASLETLAIVAYLGPCTRPDVARIRGVSADSAVANLVERGLISEAGRDDGVGGAIRYRTTPLFERVFGLESLSELPRLDDLGGDVDEIRDRLVSVAEKRPA